MFSFNCHSNIINKDTRNGKEKQNKSCVFDKYKICSPMRTIKLYTQQTKHKTKKKIIGERTEQNNSEQMDTVATILVLILFLLLFVLLVCCIVGSSNNENTSNKKPTKW